MPLLNRPRRAKYSKWQKDTFYMFGFLFGLMNFGARNEKGLHCCRPLNLAEREGFEPPVGLTLRLISSQVH